MKRWASTAATVGMAVSLLGTAIGTAPAQADPKPASAAPAPVPVTSHPDAVAAMMAAKKQGSKVEVLDDRTDSSQTFANPDGTFSYQAYNVPQWIEQGGSWKTLDPTLTTTASGSVVPTLSQSPLMLSSGGSGPLATMTVNGRQFSVTWPTALPKPTLSGATATYANVLPSGVNLQVTATAAGGVEETLIVENATAAADPALASLVQATSGSVGTTISADAGGNLTVTDANGNTLVTSPAPVMWDSSTTTPATSSTPDSASPSASPSASAMSGGANAAGADKVKVASLDETPATRSGVSGPGSRAHQGRVKVRYSKHKLSLTPDHGLLTAKSTIFPVYIDPAYVPHPATGTTLAWDEVQSAYPTTSEYNAAPGSGLGVGYQGFSSPTGIERSYYALSIPSAIYGSTILSASLNSTVTYAAASGSNSDTVDAYSTSAISSTTTWNTQPGHESGANANYPNPDATATFTTTSQSPNKAVAFNLLTSMQLIATAHNYKTWDFELANSTETNDVDLVRFADNPSFSITYNNPPATPTNLSMTPSNTVGSTAYSSTGTPVLSSSATDANGDTVQLDYQILSGTTVKASGTSTGFVNSGTPATWKPTTALANGAYTWQVRAYDGQAYSAWTTAKAFTVDTTIPPAPTVTCAGYPHGVWTPTISGGTTCTLSDTSSDVLGYSWGVDVGSGSTTWTTGTSITINPAPGYHTLSVFASSNSMVPSTVTYYVFGVGSAGITTPADQSTTSTTLPLSATAPAGATTVTFKYRVGTTGSFTSIPTAAVTDNGAAVTWPLATTAGTGVVTTPSLTWNLAQTVSDDGLLQVEAEFSAANGNLIDSPPVSVTLDRLGTGTDFGTTTAGPVTVGLQSGNASLSASDVSISSFGSGLGLSRTFNSLDPKVPGIFGPGWTSSLPVGGTSDSWSSLTDDTTYAQLTGSDGSVTTFVTGATTGGITAYTPQGSAAVSGLTLVKNSSEFILTDSSGNQVLFIPATGAGATTGEYLPHTVVQPSSTSSTGYVYDSTSTDSTYGDLMQEVAPDAASTAPSTTACPYPASSSTWGAGCRGLAFTYDPTGKLLTEVDFLSSDGTTLTKTAVADYSYDASGRLVAEWDPRISPALKTTYTYDETSTDSDYGRLTQISPAQSTTGSLAPWVLAYNDATTSPDYGKLVSVSRTHNAANGGGTAVNQVIYSVPLTTAAGGPINMDPATVATWDQTDDPTSAVAIFPADHAPGSGTITDWTYAQIDYYDAQGREVNTAAYNNGWDVTTTQYDQYGNDIRELTADNRATALAAGAGSATDAAQLETDNIYTSDGTELLDTYGPTHQAMAAGTLQTIRTHTHDIYDAGAPNNDVDADGNPYDLVTSTTVSASLGVNAPGSSDVDGRTTEYVYNNGSDNEGWILGTPLQTITDPGTSHLNITKTSTYNENSSLYGGAALQITSSQPSDTAGTGAGTSKTVYYTVGANSVDSGCGNEPAWANLVCKTEPVAQPGTSGLASLPTTQFTYNVHLEPVTAVATYTAADGSTSTRTTTSTYDAAGRATGTTVTTTGTGMGTALAPTQIIYSPTTGLPTDTRSLNSTGAETADLNTAYDDWGQVTSYLDANGHSTAYTYDLAGDTVSRSDSGDTTTLTYDGGNDHSGDMTSEVDSLAGTFGTSYDADGNLLSETYPGGTLGSYTYDSTDTATALNYTNSSWSSSLSDSVITNADGDWINRSVLDSSQTYAYDAADRLTGVQDTQNGQCTTRSYTYDADSNRLSQVTGAANSDGSCQNTTTTTETHSYDSADRLTDTGYTYDTQGDTTSTPSVDAGGTGNLTATYYANDMLAGQTQAGDTTGLTLDPAGDRVATSTDSASGVITTDDYADGTDNPTLVITSTGDWTRNLSSPAGLVAETTNSGTTLQLVNLHGDVFAVADPSTGDVTATYTYSEFGAPETGTPGTYGWEGGSQRSDQASGGQILMGARSYSTALGRFDQVDPITSGSANAYDYANQSPNTQYDPSGEFSIWHGHGHFYIELSESNQNTVLDGYEDAWYGAVSVLCAAIFSESGVGAVACGAIAWTILHAILSTVRSHIHEYQYLELEWNYHIHWKWGFIPIPEVSYDGYRGWQ